MMNSKFTAIAAILALAFILTTSGPVNVFASNGHGNSGGSSGGNSGNGSGNSGNGSGSGNQLTANNQNVTTNENTAVGITLTGNGPTGFSYVVDTQPTNGVLTGTAPNLTYTPNTNYDGADSFTFHTAHANSVSTTATVSITVNNVPLNCDVGFHEENNACVADSTGDNGSGSGDNGSGSGDNGSGDTGSGSGSGDSGSGDSGSGSGDSGSGSGTGDNGSGSGESGSGSGDSGSGSGDSGSGDTGTGDNGSGDTQPPAPVVGGRAGYYYVVARVADGLLALHGNIPSDDSTSLSQLGPMFGVLYASMDGTDYAYGAGTWNHLTEGQQVWIVEHFNELVASN